MERPQAVEPDCVVDLLQQAVELAAVGDVVARGVEMAGVEAEPEPRVVVEAVVDRGELGNGAADRAAGAGGVLHQEPSAVVAPLEALRERLDDAIERLLEAG